MSKTIALPINPVDAFVKAYVHFNETLFDNRLPACVLLVHRKRGARGYFWAEQWDENVGKRKEKLEGRHEIAMNPDTFKGRTTKDVLSTLVHEMTHLEQEVFGTPGAGANHNKEWVGLMERIGLLPYATCQPTPQPGDKPKKQTGNRVSHIVIPGQAFDASCDKLLKGGFKLTLSAKREIAPAETTRAKAKTASKSKYTCDGCLQNAWAKPGANMICGDCMEPMTYNPGR